MKKINKHQTLMAVLKPTAVLIAVFLLFAAPLSAEDIFHDERETLTEDTTHDEEETLTEETIQNEGETLTEEKTLDEGETLTEEEILDEEEAITQDTLSEEDTFLSEEDFFDDDEGFFFEAPDLIIEASSIIETRSFYDIFPHITQEQKEEVMSSVGLRHFFERGESPLMTPSARSGINLYENILKKKPSHLIEALTLLPYYKTEPDLLDIYNSLSQIQKIKDQEIVFNEEYLINIFEETTRLESARRRNPIPDPPPARFLPYSETMYMHFRDTFFGDLYIRGDVSISLHGITYSLTNFTSVRFLVFRVMKEESVSVLIYLEPVKEGILVYSISGLYIPGFIAGRIRNLNSSINRRISTILGWITDSLR